MANEQGSMDRRSILKAGILAAGAALLPRSAAAASAGGSALEAWRAEYHAHVRRFAASIAPEFSDAAVGDLADDEIDNVARRLEDRCREEFCATMEDAQGVLGASRYWNLDNWFDFYDVRAGIGCAAAGDVGDALGARWYARYQGRDEEA